MQDQLVVSATPRHRRRRERPKLNMLLHFCRRLILKLQPNCRWGRKRRELIVRPTGGRSRACGGKSIACSRISSWTPGARRLRLSKPEPAKSSPVDLRRGTRRAKLSAAAFFADDRRPL